MPIYHYQCASCDFVDEYIVDVEDQFSTQVCDLCGGFANYLPYFKFRHIGPVFSDLMDMEDNMLSRKQKQSGMRFRDHRDVERWEKENKVTRCNAQEMKESREYHQDLLSMQRQIVSTQGNDAWADEVDRMDITSATGWSDGQYNRWKTMTDKAQKDAQNGTDEPTR